MDEMNNVNGDRKENILEIDHMERSQDLPITKREKEILTLIAKGYTNQQISDHLVLSYSTVRNHISNIFAKLKVSNRSQATALAIYSGLLNPLQDFQPVTKTA